MISENQKHKLLRSLLSSSLPVLCKNGLGIPDVQFSIEAFVGITVGDGEEVILVSIKETITSEGDNISHAWSCPHENITNKVTSNIKQEVVEGGVHELDVCDLTEENEEEVEAGEIVSSEVYGRQRLDGSSDGSYASQPWMVKQERLESHIKKESHYEDSNEEIYGEEVSRVDGDDDEGDHFQSSTGHRRQKSFPNARFSYGQKGGRSRYMQRGRFRRFGGSRHAGNSSGFNGRGSVGDNSRSFDEALSIGGGGTVPYQDIMKEMCEQVVNQSMSMETQYVCHICQVRRCSKSSLMDHIRGTHLAMDKYTCGECGERFRWFMQLHRHRKKFHPEQGEEQGMADVEYAADDDAGNY